MSNDRLHCSSFISKACIIYVIIISAIPAYASTEPPADAIREARLFVAGAIYKYTIMSRNGNVYVFGSNHIQIKIDAKTRKVSSITWPRKRYSGKMRFDLDNAESLIRSWLKKRNVNLSGWILLDKGTFSPAHDRATRRFVFVRMTNDGITLRNAAIDVSMDSDGNMISYAFFDNPVTVSLKPSFTKKELIQKAIHASKLRNANMLNYQLTVYNKYENINKQMLCAEIYLRGNSIMNKSGMTEYSVIIDAHSGNVLSIIRSGVRD